MPCGPRQQEIFNVDLKKQGIMDCMEGGSKASLEAIIMKLNFAFVIFEGQNRQTETPRY